MQTGIAVRGALTVRQSIASAITLFALGVSAYTQEAPRVGALTGTLKKTRETGTIALGYRESSLPFSYLNHRRQPIGYSIDLCREIVEDVSTELDGMDIRTVLAPVTPMNRLQKVASGEIDLECGSTTANVQRRQEVAFSPIFFIAGTKLMVPKASPVKSYRDLAGKTAVATAGTTNEVALRTLAEKQKIAVSIVSAPDHEQSLEALVSGRADAFASDDVLLYGFIAMAGNASNMANAINMKVVGEYLSYDPYGLAYRRDDPAFASLIERTFTRIAGERRLEELYNKWFLRRLPTGETLNLPMGAELTQVFRMLGQPE